MKYETILFDYAGTLAYEKKTSEHAPLEVPADVRDLIALLYSSGYRLGIISNSHRYGDRLWLCNYLQKMEILSYFECVVSSGAWGIHKPDPHIYARPLFYMGVIPSRALMVGNSQSCDIVAAKKAGLATMYVDLDIHGSWVPCLTQALEDERLGTRRDLITDYVTIGSRKISCQVRHLSAPVQTGNYILIGGDEKKVKKVSLQLTREEIVDPKRTDLVEIEFE